MLHSCPDQYELRDAFESERKWLAPLASDCLSQDVSRYWRIDGRQGPVTSRSTPSILAGYLLRPSQFKGKALLDVGSGLTTLHADLASIGFAPVYSAIVDACAEVVERQRLVNPDAEAYQSFAAELPFCNERFDIVISNFCMPLWAHNAEEIRGFFQETRRVLRRGGVLAVRPMMFFTKTDSTTASAMESAIEEQQQVFDDPSMWKRLDVAAQVADTSTVVAIKQ